MADVRLTVAGRIYDISTSDGQEQHLVDLAAVVDAQARKIVGTTEPRQLLFSALMLADELHEASKKVAAADSSADGAALARAAALEAELSAAQDRISALTEAVQLQSQDLTAALQAVDAARAEAETAQAALAQAQEEAAAALAQTRTSPPAHSHALSRLAERIESLADKFEQLT